MKAWKAETEYGEYSIVVFAETRGKARAIAAGCEEFEDDKFTDIEIRRYPAMDCMYKGARVADWDDPKTRRYLVKELGWRCAERIDSECEICPAKDVCPSWEGEVSEGE